MHHMINGRLVEVITEPDGSVRVDRLRRAAGIDDNRQLVLQNRDGSNQILNPGQVLSIQPGQYFADIPNHDRGTRQAASLPVDLPQQGSRTHEQARPILQRQLELLSGVYDIWLDEWNRFVIVCGLKLPPGFNRKATDVLLELQPDYPISPPGQGNSRVFVAAGLRYWGRELAEYREHIQPTYATPRFGPWAWICYRNIHWDPFYDDLVWFLEMLRADLTNPPTIQGR